MLRLLSKDGVDEILGRYLLELLVVADLEVLLAKVGRVQVDVENVVKDAVDVVVDEALADFQVKLDTTGHS